MLAEVVKLIQNTAAQQAEQILLYSDERKDVVSHCGEIHTFEKSPDPRRHTVRTVASMAAAAEKWGQSGGVLWVDHDMVVLIIDDLDRLDSVLLPLEIHETFKVVRELVRPIPHREFVTLLRRQLRGCVDKAFVNAISKIEIHNRESRQSEAVKGRDKGMGEFHRELANADGIPETVVLTTPVFRNPDIPYRASIQMFCDVDLESCAVLFVPLPGELDRVTNEALKTVESMLEATGLPIFRGSC